LRLSRVGWLISLLVLHGVVIIRRGVLLLLMRIVTDRLAIAAGRRDINTGESSLRVRHRHVVLKQ